MINFKNALKCVCEYILNAFPRQVNCKVFNGWVIYHVMFLSFFRICEKEHVSDHFMHNKKASLNLYDQFILLIML